MRRRVLLGGAAQWHPLRATRSPGSRATAAMSVASDTSRAGLMATPGVAQERDPATKGFQFQQTMLRIKDPKASLDFYTRVLGMTLLCRIDVPSGKFTIYFVGYKDGGADAVPQDPRDRIEATFDREATLELTHNWGSEDGDWKAHSGNEEPKGFGHVGIEVPDVYAACERFESLSVAFQKKPDGGNMKGLAFIKDPDGYWIEIFNAKKCREFQDFAEKDK